ncbi:DUF1307 domain-containing protein [Erysipelothrix aquatica]|uniref:DUF1307 domain-containing protein n=1 Tax=Erysipelothrix aquatica TaxID=2683714 RepID=UPI00135C2AD3|nr:DUF1307 domain-containing protein [Erysipelothrix aquatica]
MKKLLVVLAMGMLLITGCTSTGKETVYECKGADMLGLPAKVTQTITTKGDKVSTQKIVTVLDIKALSDIAGLSAEETSKLMLDQVKAVHKDLEKIAGLEVAIETTDTSLTEINIIDYAKTDLKKLQELQLIEGQGDKEAKFVSWEATQKTLESNGFTCSEGK